MCRPATHCARCSRRPRERVRLLWLSAGTAEVRFVEALHRLHETLEPIGIRHELYISEGTSHEWQTWRRSLHAFAPLLFRQSAASLNL